MFDRRSQPKVKDAFLDRTFLSRSLADFGPEKAEHGNAPIE